jgi:hypothetical protein
MMAKLPFFSLIAFTVFISCSDTKQEEESIQTYNKAVIDPVVAKKGVPDSLIIKSILQPPASVRSLPGLPTDAPQTTGSAALPGTNNARLNPKHGMPGHRCDIAEGAPLDSKPLPTNTAPVQPALIQSQALPVTTAAPVTQKVATGMNPAHGQPNHRCDIAVGAPLNSKPVSANTLPAVTKTQVPAATSIQQPTQKTAPGMNPAHGQPGHRCDIAVGAPLNSKPTIPATAPAANPVNPEPAKADSTKR